MFNLLGKTNIDFMGNRFYWYAVSAFVVLGSLGLIAVKGFNYSIEFTGGTMIQVSFDQPMTLGELREGIGKNYPGLEIQSFSGDRSFILRAKGAADQVEAAARRIEEAVRVSFPDKKVTVDAREFIGPVVGKLLFKRTLLAIILSLLGIVVYVAFRFDNPVWGFTGVLALAHDVIGGMGLTILFNMEFNLLIVAALLTVAGFSINDTIVIFDRMRENMKLMRKSPFDQIVNTSINETLSRTIITVLTVVSVLIVLFFLGGEVIHDFAAVLLFGTVIGSYSTICVAAPLVDDWEHLNKRS